jgi:hypothetical protein
VNGGDEGVGSLHFRSIERVEKGEASAAGSDDTEREGEREREGLGDRESSK